VFYIAFIVLGTYTNIFIFSLNISLTILLSLSITCERNFLFKHVLNNLSTISVILRINIKTNYYDLNYTSHLNLLTNGYYIWIEDYIIPTYNKNGQLVAVESITRNIQEKKDLEQRLENLGYHDDLTGLFNKNYLLKEMYSLNNSINVPVGILVCDLDKLKYINDSLGHSTGDSLLKNTGKVLQSLFNSEHVVVRNGGDEFVVIMKNKPYLEVERLYDELQIIIKQYNENNSDMPIEISMGLAYSETSLNTMKYTLDIADSNMYRNKKQKKQ
jgi:diguanylate cyclase (GGDEF)-like protein